MSKIGWTVIQDMEDNPHDYDQKDYGDYDGS